MTKKVIIILGPTGVGKTSIALKLAQHFRTSIISADSRQCYREMTIGVAKPSRTQLKTVQHYFINTHSIFQPANAADFERYALQVCNSIFAQLSTVIMAGGTGLYIRAFCEGLDDIPSAPAAWRMHLQQEYEAKGLNWLQDLLTQEDPAYMAASAEKSNPRRLLRALEVIRTTGKSITEFRSQQSKQRPFEIIKVGLELPRNELYGRINQRVDEMMESGLLREVQSLFPFQHQQALDTVGYVEMIDHLKGKSSLQEAVEKIKQHTRQYAKRQMTWFKKDETIEWFSPYDHENIRERVEKFVH